MRMKKYISILIAAVLIVCLLSACGPKPAQPEDNGSSIRIVTTIFPVYDWVMNILGDNPGGLEVTLLLDSGVDLHSFQPTVDNIRKISTCDFFVCVGGASDEWVDDVLSEAENKDMTVIGLLDTLGDSIKEEELVEGMKAEPEEEGDEPEYDEHVWLSLRNASVLVAAISDKLQTLDPENAEIYRKNAAAYSEKLDALDKQYQEAVSSAKTKTLLFGDRFPFRYLTDDYGLEYYAAFAGCSAETEASFETITFLAGKTDELSLGSVMTIEGSDQKLAETIIQTTKSQNLKILSLDSMQSVTAKDIEQGVSYLSIMEKNLSVLEEALN